MEYTGEEERDFSDVIDNLMNMFGDVLSRDVISTVVESCCGDLNISIDAIMNITSEGNVMDKEESHTEKTVKQETMQPLQQTEAPSQSTVELPTAQVPQQKISYASAIQPTGAQSPATGAIPKQNLRPHTPFPLTWTNQIRDIVTNHNQGNRTMIILRGLPGSGKSFLAKQIVDIMVGATPNNYKTHIFNTDDYFMVRGQYVFEKYKLGEAHDWNHRRVNAAAQQGLSPIIVDNTNVELWEMTPYTTFAVNNGYIIEVVEPNTPWARKPNQLVRKTAHDVPISTIRKKLDDFCNGVTGETLMQAFRLSYPAHMTPPVKRNIPPISIPEGTTTVKLETKSELKPVKSTTTIPSTVTTAKLVADDGRRELLLVTKSTDNSREQTQEVYASKNDELTEEVDQPQEICGTLKECTLETKSREPTEMEIDQNVIEDEDLSEEERKKQQYLLEAQKRLEEIERVENEWENGEQWDEPVDSADGNSNNRANMQSRQEGLKLKLDQSKPPRKPNVEELGSQSPDVLMQSVNKCQDWSKIAMFMPPWYEESETSTKSQDIPVVHTWSNGTCMEIGDTDLNGKNKVIVTTPRDINEYYIPPKEKIPEKRMLDKSSMTNEAVLSNQYRCSNEEKHFIAFRKLFKNIERSVLRDIFDNCCGDVNWAVEIVLDGMVNKEFKTIENEDISDTEEECLDQCQCLATYNIIPDGDQTLVTPDLVLPIAEPVQSQNTSQNQKKKSDLSDESQQIKRQIEQNVVISDNHYSQHCLKIRRLRRGEFDKLDEASTSESLEEDAAVNPTPSTDLSDDESSTMSQNGDGEKIVNVTLGWDCIKELDRMFGRNDMQYPESVQPKISLPLCVLNQINALWMESLMFQLETLARQSAELVRRDEEFARQLAYKEQELISSGKEPAVPDFKEIMDMDLAISLYQKDVAEWRNNMPTDLAAKLTRDKLFNLFPEVNQDTLTELLMAHENNFQATVEVLLMSTGRNEVLEDENGLNKFVMTKEIERQEKILEERRKELSDIEWPMLTQGETVNMETVDGYRDEANQHLNRANLNHQKAQEYIRRGMTQVASYYSEIAQFHRQKYDHANSMAVASLMQYHALHSPNCHTVDLHYLRVKEAMESLDLFLDTHITRLRATPQGRKGATLFIITGRGSHSPGRPRIKPATKKRLGERGLQFAESNPGLLQAHIGPDCKLAYQINVP